MKIYGDGISGNCYKIKLLLSFLEMDHEWIHIDVLKKQTHTDVFKQLNPNARIPVLELSDGQTLWESNAILNYLAEDTDLLPSRGMARAKTLQWQFFEQYSHEPYIAVARYIKKYLGLPKERKEEFKGKQAGGHKALTVMDKHLSKQAYFVGNRLSIADVALYAYTHVAHEGDFDLSSYTNIRQWFKRIESTDRYISMS